MADTATVTGYGFKKAAHAQAMASARPYLEQGYQITNEVFIPEADNGCMIAIVLIILFVTIIGLVLLPLFFMRQKKVVCNITLTKF